MKRQCAAVALLATLYGCSEKAAVPRSPSFATVGQQTLSKDLLDYYIEQQTEAAPEQVGPELKQKLQTQLLALAAAAQSGKGLDRPSIRAAIELSRLEILAKAAADEAGINTPPSDTDLENAYRAYVTALPAQEYHVAQIQVGTEPLAVNVLGRLSKGEAFAQVASKVSADESNARGGDIGWIQPDRLPAAFVAAVQKLKAGDYTHEAVKTPYGWHIIELLEVRPANPPPIDNVRAQLLANLKAERYQRFLSDALVHTTVTK